MAKSEQKKFNQPDEVRTFEKGKLELIKMSGGFIGRLTLEPGWRWSKHVKPIAGTRSCEAAHSGYVLSGRMRIVMDDGQEAEIGPGDYAVIPPGHDAWTVGDETCVIVDFAGMEQYARGGREDRARPSGEAHVGHH